MLMNTKALLLGLRDGALITIVLGLFIMYAFYPCVIETAENQKEFSHAENK